MSRKPDYILKAMNKETDEKTGRIGAAWQAPDGSISIALDLCVVLDARDKLVLTLFPQKGGMSND
jgi:hypothetical protein